MPKDAMTIQVREIHRQEYRRTMRRIVAGSILLWFIMAIVLANNDAGGTIVPVSIVMLAGLAVIRVSMWIRYRLDMRAELTQQRAFADDR